jgi:hypothetical protein
MKPEFNIVIMRTEEAKKGLRALVQELPLNAEVVEIGSYAGESAEIFIRCGKLKQLWCVDPWQNDYDGNDKASYTCPMQVVEQCFDKMRENLPILGGRDCVTKLKMTSQQASTIFEPASLDFVYIDGCHLFESVMEDLTLWLPKIRPNGLIGGHDFAEWYPDIMKAVREVVGEPDKTFADSSWIKRRP